MSSRKDVSTGWPEPVRCSLPSLLLPQSPLASLPLAWQPLEAELKGGGSWALGQAREGTGRGEFSSGSPPLFTIPTRKKATLGAGLRIEL